MCGHTHVQYDRRVGPVRLVNAGSVGMPYEGSPDARWAILEDGNVELVATAYDAEAAFERLERAGFPTVRASGSSSRCAARSARRRPTAAFESRRGA